MRKVVLLKCLCCEKKPRLQWRRLLLSLPLDMTVTLPLFTSLGLPVTKNSQEAKYKTLPNEKKGKTSSLSQECQYDVWRIPFNHDWLTRESRVLASFFHTFLPIFGFQLLSCILLCIFRDTLLARKRVLSKCTLNSINDTHNLNCRVTFVLLCLLYPWSSYLIHLSWTSDVSRQHLRRINPQG